jgi:polyphosphate kinase 2 (PPK2 family)
MSCPASIPKDAGSTVSNIQARPNSSMTFYGARPVYCRSGGQIGIFNRSYYEEVLIARVHPKILRAEGLPSVAEESLWLGRFESIVNLEKHLHRNGTAVLKFFLHISAQEQRKRFLQRIDDPDKNWKFSMADMAERAYWKQYMHAYAECLSATSTAEAPWYAIPADDKKNARLLVSRIILDTLGSLPMRFPKLDAARRRELKQIRTLLLANPHRKSYSTS